MKKDKKHAGKIPASSERKRKSGTVKIRVTESEAEAIKSKANQWGVTVSQYLRDAALNHEVKKMIITNNRDLNLLTPMRESEVLAELKSLQLKFSSIDWQLLDARAEFSREQIGKISDYEFEQMKDFWLPEDGGETDGDDVHPSA